MTEEAHVSKNEEAENKPELQINALVRFKKSLEQSGWNKRIALRVIEASAFAGMFLCTNPLGFKISVIIAVIALLIDIFLGYESWKQEWQFKEMTL